MTCGDLGLHLDKGCTQDKSSPLATCSLPVGSLRIADVGYFSLSRVAHMSEAGSYWLTRIKVQGTLYCDANSQTRRYELYEFLQSFCPFRPELSAWVSKRTRPSQDQNGRDVNIRLGKTEKLHCRLLAVRVPQEVAHQRRRQRRARLQEKGQTPSRRQLQMADWTVFATNAGEPLLALEQAIVLMRLRWQIELLFKLWKQHGRLDKWRSEKPWRILGELYAKLIGIIIQHWLLLTSAFSNPARSLVKAVKTIRRHAMQVACAVASGELHQLLEVCQIIASCLATGCRMNNRKKEPTTYQLLLALEENP